MNDPALASLAEPHDEGRVPTVAIVLALFFSALFIVEAGVYAVAFSLESDALPPPGTTTSAAR